MAQQQRNDKSSELVVLKGINDFTLQLEKLIEATQKELSLLTHTLPTNLFAKGETVDSISSLVRRHKLCNVRILVTEPRDLIHQNHALLQLQQRLPSKILCRKLSTEVIPPKHSFVIGDQNKLLLQHERDLLNGFSDLNAGPEAQKLLEEFNHLWDRQSTDIPDLKQLSI